jgi:beta-lactamase regulating signal transducer with metallopeptidase domain
VSEFTQHALEWVGIQSLQMVPLALLLALVWRLSRKASAHARYLLGLLVLAKCLTPGFLTLPLNVSGTPKMLPTAVAQVAQSGGLTPETAVHGVTLMPAVAAPAGVSLGTVCFFIWIIGASAMLGIAGVKAINIQIRLCRTRAEPDLDLECEFLDLSRRIGLRWRPKLCLLRSTGQPFVWGILRGCIYLPAGFPREGKTEQRQAVIAHELAHVLRWDALVNFLQVLVQAVFWFHPAIWWLNARLRHEREKCCDEMAIASMRVDAEVYGAALVDHLVARFSPAVPASSLAMSGKAKELEDRLRTILTPNRLFRFWPTAATLFAMALAAGLLLPVGLKAERDGPGTGKLETEAKALVWQATEGLISGDELFSELPVGRQQLGGVGWIVHRVTPVAISVHMPVNGKFRRLHLLHGLDGTAEPGTTVGWIRFHYRDGNVAELRIRYGEHLRECRFAAFSPVRDPGSAMAWTGSNPWTRAAGQGLRLYRSTFTNPRPEEPVTQVEYSASQPTPTLLLAAATIE